MPIFGVMPRGRPSSNTLDTGIELMLSVPVPLTAGAEARGLGELVDGALDSEPTLRGRSAEEEESEDPSFIVMVTVLTGSETENSRA